MLKEKEVQILLKVTVPGNPNTTELFSYEGQSALGSR